MATDPSRSRLKPALTSWFEALRVERNVSSNTITSYKDTWRILYRFGSQERGLPVSGDWRIGQIDRDFILAFLSYLEGTRKCCISTRNQRLAAIQSFFSHVQAVELADARMCHSIIEIQRKRTHRPVVGYLESDELKAVFDTVPVGRAMGLRDLALLVFAYNTGARVHEIAGLRRYELKFGSNAHVRLWGKGRKQRELPLFDATVEVLQTYLSSPQRVPYSDSEGPYVFLGLRGQRMTRFSVAQVIQRAFERAAATCPTLRDRALTAHCMRHTTAVHLLNNGATTVTIQNWLGHDSIDSVQVYLAVNLKNKRDILERCLDLDYVKSRLSLPSAEEKPVETAEDWLRRL